ncbi:MAG: hypothetical protein WCD07_10795 [Burkholderiales bacterium]
MRFTSFSTLISFIVCISLPLPTFADSAAPKHNCAKPAHPGTSASEDKIKAYQLDINAYRDCINKFAQEQKMFSETHLTAGNQAIEEFNTFVNTEVNPKKKE